MIVIEIQRTPSIRFWQNIADECSGIRWDYNSIAVLPQVVAWRLFGAKPLPEPIPTGLMSIGPLGTKLSEIPSQNTELFMYLNVFEGVVCEMAAILSRGRWVNSFEQHFINTLGQHLYRVSSTNKVLLKKFP